MEIVRTKDRGTLQYENAVATTSPEWT